MPESMRKTSVYLTDRERRHLAALAQRTGRSQSELVREAIAAYDVAPDRDFALLRAAEEVAARSAEQETQEDAELRNHLTAEHERAVVDHRSSTE